MATETLNLEVKSDIKSVSNDADGLSKNLDKVKKSSAGANKEISGGMQAANAGVGMLDRFTGGLATKFMDVGKAAMKSGKAMRTAMISSGIGLAVAAIGLLVQHWDAIGEALGFINKDLEKQKVLNEENLRVVDSELGLLQKQINFNKTRGISNAENLKKHKELLVVKQGILKLSISTLETELLKEQAAAREIVWWKKLQAGMRKGLGFQKMAMEGLADEMAIDEDERKKINDVTLALLKLKGELIDLDDVLNPIDDDGGGTGIDKAQVLADFKAALAEKTAASEADTDIKRIEREREKHIAELDTLKVTTKEKAKLKEELDKLYDDRITEIENNRYWEKVAADNDTWNEEQQEKLDKQKASDEAMAALKEENALADIDLERTKTQEILKIQYDKDKLALEGMENQAALEKELEDKFLREKQEITDEYDKQDLEKAKKLTAAKVEMLQQGLSVIQSMMDMQSTQIEKDYSNEMKMAEKNGQDTEKIEAKFEKKRRDQAKKMKAMKIAMALVDTYQSAVSAYSAALQMGLPGLVLAPVSAGLAIAAGLANVAMIEKQPLGGSGGSSGGGGGGGGGSPAPQMMSGAFELGGGQEVEPARAYVVSDDITNNQNKLAIIRRRATI